VFAPKALPNGLAAFLDFARTALECDASSHSLFVCLPLLFLQFLADLFFFVTDVAKMTLEKR
jgi:uncharacterized membrane protein